MILRHDSFVIILSARRILCTIYILFSLYWGLLPPFIDILRHLTVHCNGPFAERSDVNRHRFVLPNNFLFVTWLEILSIYCLIEKFCQLIELFEFTELLIFWFVLQNKLKFEYILKILVSANITQRQSPLSTAAAQLALHKCPTY